MLRRALLLAGVPRVSGAGIWHHLVAQALPMRLPWAVILASIVAIELYAGLPLAAWQLGISDLMPAALSRETWWLPLYAVLHLIILLAVTVLAVDMMRRANRAGERAPVGPSTASRTNAVDVGRLVSERRLTADFLRSTARDGVHAATTPLATIKMSLQTVRRAVPTGDPRALRALEIVELATDDLTRLTRSSWARLEGIAEILVHDRQATDALTIVRDHIDVLSDTTVFEFNAPPPGTTLVAIPPGILDTLVEAVLQATLEASPSQRGYSVGLTLLDNSVVLRVESLDGPSMERARLSEDLDRNWRIQHSRYIVAVLGGRLSVTLPTTSACWAIVVKLPKA